MGSLDETGHCNWKRLIAAYLTEASVDACRAAEFMTGMERESKPCWMCFCQSVLTFCVGSPKTKQSHLLLVCVTCLLGETVGVLRRTFLLLFFGSLTVNSGKSSSTLIILTLTKREKVFLFCMFGALKTEVFDVRLYVSLCVSLWSKRNKVIYIFFRKRKL